MALHGKKTLTAIQNGIDSLTDFKAGNVSGKLYKHWDRVPVGRMEHSETYRLQRQDYTAAKLAGREAVYVVFSYGTPIAWTFDTSEAGFYQAAQWREWVQPDVKYSVTTTNHQSRVAVAIANPGFYAYDANGRRAIWQ
jgi:hypothetical protein